MMRDPNSARSIKWIERNSLDNPSCADYVSTLCVEVFGFKEFYINDYELKKKALWITYGDNSYVICVSRGDVGIVVLQLLPKKKLYCRIPDIAFYGDSCWFDCLNWIKNNNKTKDGIQQ